MKAGMKWANFYGWYYPRLTKKQETARKVSGVKHTTLRQNPNPLGSTEEAKKVLEELEDMA